MENNMYLIYPESAESGALETLPDTEGMELLTERQFAENYKGYPHAKKICVTSEATLETILNNLNDKTKKSAIQSMKNKHLFREILQDDYPSLKYRQIKFDEINQLKVSGKQVLKPVKGCFGTAVKIIDEHSDLQQIAKEIKQEISQNSSILSESVISQSEFILEDFISGEEYAVDMFYDAKGRPHIVNIYHHPLPKHREYLHMIYYTSKAIFEKVHADAITFFKKLSDKLPLKNIVLHSEFKLAQELIPIEINAMRFGGMGLGNMIYHSLKINPYQCFVEERSPDWEKIWEKHPTPNFVYFIAYNGTQIDKTRQRPNLQKLESAFTNILNRTTFDYQKQLAFGVYTLQESADNINKLLQIDFNEYFEDLRVYPN